MSRLKELVYMLMVFMLVIVIILPIPFLGIPSGNDLHQHFQFALTFYDSILSGNLFPSWSAHENYGFGGIGIRFYPPIPYYVLAFMRMLTGNWYEAGWLTFLFWVIVGYVGIYLWAREWLTPTNSAWAALIFSITPYHLTQIYQFFIYAEFAATAVLPFCFAFLTKVCRRGNGKDIVLFAISVAVLVLTHIPTTLIGIISLGVYAALILDWRKWRENCLKLAVSFGLGLVATSFHWLKIVTEMKWLNHAGDKFASGYYDYKSHFFPLFFNSPPSIYSIKLQWLTDVIIILTVVLLLPLILHWFLKRNNADVDNNNKKVVRAILITALFAFLMSTSFSMAIWQNLPLFNKIQFPWRWTSAVSVFGAVCFITGAVQLIRFKQLHISIVKYSLITIVLCLMLFNVTQIILPMAPHTRTEFEEKLSDLLHEESFKCWWTVWAKPSAFEQKEKLVTESRQMKINSWQAEERSFEVTSGESATTRIATFYYPHWQAEINGQPAEIKMAEDGTMLIDLPAEAAAVKVWFQEPMLIRLGFFLSVLTWLGLIIAGIALTAKSWKKDEIGEYEYSH